jgi:hypothetical protein
MSKKNWGKNKKRAKSAHGGERKKKWRKAQEIFGPPDPNVDYGSSEVKREKSG